LPRTEQGGYVKNSDIELKNRVATCVQITLPHVEKATRTLDALRDPDQWFGFQRKISLLNRLKERANDTTRGLRKKEGEPHPLDELHKLIARAAPPGYADVMNVLEQAHAVLRGSEVNRIERQIDFGSVESQCLAILQVKEMLLREVGPSPADLIPTADVSAQPVTEAEITTVEDQIKELERRQRALDLKEQERSEIEQQEAKLKQAIANQFESGATILELARKLQRERNMTTDHIRIALWPFMKAARPKASKPELREWWRNSLARELRR
jgi:hypothetical protein